MGLSSPSFAPAPREGPPQKGGLLPSGRYPRPRGGRGLSSTQDSTQKAPLFVFLALFLALFFGAQNLPFPVKEPVKGGGYFSPIESPKKPERKPRFKRGEARETKPPKEPPREPPEGPRSPAKARGPDHPEGHHLKARKRTR